MTAAQKTRRIKNVIGLILTPLVLYGLLRLFEYVQVYRPRGELVASPSQIHEQPESFLFPSGETYRCHAWYYAANRESLWNDWVLLYSHGNGGNISYRLDLHDLWLQEGFNVLAYDYRGYGQSSGRPSEAGTYQDIQAAYDWLLAKGFPPDKIIALGESLGGGVASHLASQVELGALVLQSTFTSISDIGKEWFPWLPTQTLGTIDYATRDRLPDLKIPVLILHSRSDSLIPFHHAERNYELAQAPKRFIEIKGDHNDSLYDNANRYRQAIQEFKTLLPQPESP